MTTPVGTKSGLQIVNQGRSPYHIFVPLRASAAVNTAAQELQQLVKQATGVQLPILMEGARIAGPGIFLGPTRRFLESPLAAKLKGLAEDGVLYGVDRQDLLVSGQNERGQLYVVYELLERTLGVRFIAHDCTMVPRTRTWTVPVGVVRYAPPFMYRETLYWDSFPLPMAARHRLNGPMTRNDASTGGKIAFQPYVHSANKLVPPETYFDQHPEYFSLVNGKRIHGEVHAQLCWTNPDVLKIATAQVLRWMDEYPDVPIIDVSQNDGEGACECEQCARVVAEEGSQHGPILRFVNAVADEVARKDPNRWVETLAYAYSMRPPAITRPRPNVIIRLCHAGCYFHGFETCGLGANLTQYIEGWSKLTRRIFIWHYATNFAHYLAPCQNLDGLCKDIRYYAQHGVNGLMVQANYQGPGGELAELRQYLAARLMWDPAQDPMALRREFCNAYYGKASQPVMRWLSMMDTAAKDPNVHAFGAWTPSDTVKPHLVRNGLRVLEQARRQADDTDTERRVRKLLLPLWYMQVTWPDKYGLSEDRRPAVAAEIASIIRECGITHVREGGENASGWLPSIGAP